jgi:predicted  nucleic acid-binding Zn-ribbon protein
MELEQLRLELEAEAVAAEHAFAVERERLLRQLVASNTEKQRLTGEVRRLQKEMELVRARFEEVYRA